MCISALALLAVAVASPLAAQDGSEMTAARTPENAIKFLSMLAEQGEARSSCLREHPLERMGRCMRRRRMFARPAANGQQEIGWDISKFALGALDSCKTRLSITNTQEAYVNNVLQTQGEGHVHTMAFRHYTINVPGTITYNDWVPALRALDNVDFDWSKVSKVTPERPYPTTHYLRIANSGVPGGSIRLYFGDNEEIAKRAQLAIDVVVKSCDPWPSPADRAYCVSRPVRRRPRLASCRAGRLRSVRCADAGECTEFLNVVAQQYPIQLTTTVMRLNQYDWNLSYKPVRITSQDRCVTIINGNVYQFFAKDGDGNMVQTGDLDPARNSQLLASRGDLVTRWKIRTAPYVIDWAKVSYLGKMLTEPYIQATKSWTELDERSASLPEKRKWDFTRPTRRSPNV